MTNLEFQNFDVETKQDSAEKLAAIVGQPTYNFVFSPEFNKIVDAIKFIRDNFGAQNINQVLNNGQEVTDQRAIIYPDNGISSSRIENGEVYFENNGSDYSISFFVGGLRIQSISNSSHFTELYFETPTANNAWMIPNESGTAASRAYVELLIDQLINGAPVDANTLKELNDKIVALQAIIGGTAPDGNSIVDTVAELLAVFSSYPEGTDIATVLAGKVNVADVVNDLNQLVAGKVLDARQGKALADLITAKWTAVDATGILKGIMKLYTAFGSNTDGTMTQKAITEAFASITPIETTTDGTVTSGTSNTVSSWVLIPAGTYGVGMTLDTIANSKKTGANGTLTHRRYANTSPDLTGSPILLGSTSGAGGQLQLQLQRFLKIKTIDGSGLGTEITSTSTSPVSDYGVTTQAPVSVSINWQNDVYIIDSVQCASSSDSARVSSLKVRR